METNQEKDGLLYITKRDLPVSNEDDTEFDANWSLASMTLEVTSDTQDWLAVNNDPRWKEKKDLHTKQVKKWIEMVCFWIS